MSETKLHKPPRRWPLILIALDKLVKAVALVVASFLLQALGSPEKRQAAQDWLDNARLEPHNWFMHRVRDLIASALGISPQTVHLLHLGVILAAIVYLIEGVGLYFDQKWAEWVVAVSTAMFLPVEIYEICLQITWPRCLLFVGNLLIAIYLAWRLHRQAVIKRERAQHPELAAK